MKARFNWIYILNEENRMRPWDIEESVKEKTRT